MRLHQTSISETPKAEISTIHEMYNVETEITSAQSERNRRVQAALFIYIN